MIHYKFEGCTEVREANIQFDPDNNEMGKRILKELFGETTPPCTLEFIRDENGIYVFKRNWSFNHVYIPEKPKPYKRKRRWKENHVTKPRNNWKRNNWKRNNWKRNNWKRNNYVVKKIN